jgi:hypothetical protein
MAETFNVYGENLVNLFRNIYYVYAIFLLLIGLNYIFLKRIFRANYKVIIIILVIVSFLDYTFTVQAYKNGEKLIGLRNLGIKIVECIEKYKIENNSLPQNLQALNPCLPNGELEKINKAAKYNVYKGGDSVENYSLTIYEDFLGFYYLSYNQNEKKFVYTDE